MTPHTVNIVCAKRPVRFGCVPATWEWEQVGVSVHYEQIWRCSFCGARVKVTW